MDLAEIMKKKAETETAIREILFSFSSATGLAVESINFEMMGQTGLPMHCTKVELEIRL